MKTTFFLFFYFTFSLTLSQEISNVKKAKIGKYNYEICLKDFYNYENDEYGINYYIRLKEKEQYIGNFLSYRTFLKSRNAPIVDGKLPPNPLLKFKDREVTGMGKIEIKKDKQEITNTFIKYKKNYDIEPDSIKTVYRQMNSGFFRLILIKEYINGKEKVILKK